MKFGTKNTWCNDFQNSNLFIYIGYFTNWIRDSNTSFDDCKILKKTHGRYEYVDFIYYKNLQLYTFNEDGNVNSTILN